MQEPTFLDPDDARIIRLLRQTQRVDSDRDDEVAQLLLEIRDGLDAASVTNALSRLLQNEN
jgi:hypothetical protein